MTNAPSGPGTFPVRTIGDDDDWAAFLETDSIAFGMTVPDELNELERDVRGAASPPSTGDPVGIATAYSFDLIPGAVVPAAGISWVGKPDAPAARSAGADDPSLHEIRERGGSHCDLWASEPMIYGRFGGLASRAQALEASRSSGRCAPTYPPIRRSGCGWCPDD
jgi:hypothetical protein